MITPIILLDIPLAPRTLLRQLLDQLPTGTIFCLLDLTIRPIIILRTSFLPMPGYLMRNAMACLASHTTKPRRRIPPVMDLSRFTALRDAPSETRDGF